MRHRNNISNAALIRSLALKLLTAIVTVRQGELWRASIKLLQACDNINQNVLLEYLMLTSVFGTLVQVSRPTAIMCLIPAADDHAQHGAA